MPSIMVREQHSMFTTLTLLLLTKGIIFIGTTWESFWMALSMAVELSGSSTMLTVTSPAWARMTGISLKKCLTMLVEDSMVTTCCGTTMDQLVLVTGDAFILFINLPALRGGGAHLSSVASPCNFFHQILEMFLFVSGMCTLATSKMVSFTDVEPTVLLILTPDTE